MRRRRSMRCRWTRSSRIAAQLLTDYQNKPAGQALSRAGRPGPRRRDQGRLWRCAAARGRDQLRKTARLQGRVRGGAALHRRQVRAAAARPVRGRFQVHLQPRAADPRRRQRCAGPAEEARLRRLDVAGVQVLAKLRCLRGTALDIFARSPDRKLERDLIAGYEKDVATVLSLLSPVNARHRDRTAVAARPHPRLRPGEGEGGQGRQSALRAARRRSRQSAAAPRQIAAE